MDSTTQWPPPYRVRTSRRAKRVVVQISPHSGLEIIIPQHRRRQPNIDLLLSEKRQWIEKNLPPPGSQGPLYLPENLYLSTIQKTVRLQYQEQNTERLTMCCNHCFLRPLRSPFMLCNHNDYLIVGPIKDHSMVFKSLKRFLKVLAVHFLTPWLQTLSLETQLYYSSVSFRRQSTLWGSCNTAKKISLNIHLLFLPEELTRYVLLHELCHTQYLNHSKRYWALLKKFDPQCLQHRKALASAGQYLPAWLHQTEFTQHEQHSSPRPIS